MRIAVIEDEKAHSDLLLCYLKDWSTQTNRPLIPEAFSSAESFWFRYEEKKDFDLLFIDIQMAGMNGMELAKRIRRQNSDIVIVFTTADSGYLEEGYEVEALHYLLKPLSREKVKSCLEKALSRRREECFVMLHTAEETLKIRQESINYVEARGRSSAVGLAGEPGWLDVKESLSELEQLLKEGEFVKCHRSFLCRLSNIHHIGKEDVVFDDGSAVPVSRRLYQKVNQAFIAYFRRTDR